MMSDVVEPAEAGADSFKTWSREVPKYLAQRYELNDGERIFDVSYSEIAQNARAVVASIYERAGRKLSAEARRSFDDWSNENPQNRFGTHRYTLEQFGLTRGAIEVEFEAYIEHSERACSLGD